MPRGKKEEGKDKGKTQKLEVDFKEKEKGSCQKDVEIRDQLPIA